jgi:hypothetical protein
MRIRARYMHHAEVAADMGSGYLINLLLFVVVYNWMFGHDVHILENASGGFIFMVAGYIRKYFWRRTFSKWIGQIYERQELQERTGEN